jgi:hypothetical protein
LNIGKNSFKNAARKNDQIKSVTGDDASFWTTFIGGLLTWLSTHSHASNGAPPTQAATIPANPGSITGKITAGSSQISIGDK